MEPRTAIVTGASHGIGAYIARALAARGLNLLCHVGREVLENPGFGALYLGGARETVSPG